MKSYSSKEVIAILKKDGWFRVDGEGDHHQFSHPTKKGRVTITHHKKIFLSERLKALSDKQALNLNEVVR